MQYLKLSWQDIEKLCMKLAEEIKKRKLSNYAFIALLRGGIVPLRLLSDYLGINEFYFLRVKFYKAVGKTGKKPEIEGLGKEQIEKIMEKGRVLILDDIADTGKSLIAAINYLKKEGIKEIKTATLIKKPHSEIEPDIFIEQTSAWVIFPWEKTETARDLMKKSKGELEKAGIRRDEIFKI